MPLPPDKRKLSEAWSLFREFHRRFWNLTTFDTAFFSLVALINAIFESLSLYLIWPLIGLIVNPEAARASFYGRALEKYTPFDPGYAVALGMLCLTGIYFLKNIFILLSNVHEAHIFARWKDKLCSELYDKILHAPFEFHNKRGANDLAQIIIMSVPYILNQFVARLFVILSNVILCTVVVIFVVCAVSHYVILGVALGVAALVVQHRILRQSSRRIGQEFLNSSGENMAILNQTFSAFKEVHMFQVYRRFSANFKANMHRLNNIEKWVRLHEKLPPLASEFLFICILMVCMFLINKQIHSTQSAFQQLGILVVAFFRLIPTLNEISRSLTMINSSVEPLHNFFTVIDELETAKLPTATEEADPGPREWISGDIEFEDITHDFFPGHYILHDVNVAVPRGSLTVFVGPSGSGKSTLLNMMMGFVTPDNGEVLAGGVPIQSHLSAWRRRIAIVMQDFYVLNSSIAENVAFGQQRGEIDEQKVIAALRQMGLEEVYMQREKGIWSPVGENGKLLSGGQRQRLALARALYFDKDIWVLDEATSSLDVHTELQIMNYIAKLKGKITVIMSAHRFSVVRHADKIVMLRDGMIVGQGKFSTLLETNPDFLDLYNKSQDAKAAPLAKAV